jgi:NAD(P)H dehydrogenase (quinone)
VKFADGNPYGAGKVTGDSTDLEDADLDAIDHLVTRVLDVSDRLTA